MLSSCRAAAAALLLAGTLLGAGCSDEDRGAVLFEREGCNGCHSFKGRGGNTGPDLTAVTERRSEAWIRRQLKAPAKNNPLTRMPAFSHLTRREMGAIIRYLKT